MLWTNCDGRIGTRTSRDVGSVAHLTYMSSAYRYYIIYHIRCDIRYDKKSGQSENVVDLL